MPTLLMQEFSGNLLPDSVGILENMRREQRDAEQFLQQEYGIRLGSIGAGGGGRGQHVEMQLNRSRHHSEHRNRSTLVVDLENAMHKLVRERGLMIEHEGQSSGSLLTERGLPDGFWIRYRARDVEGLIQAGARPDQQGATMIIEERTRRNCLSIGKSHYDPRLQDW
jgi:hypothetical protein